MNNFYDVKHNLFSTTDLEKYLIEMNISNLKLYSQAKCIFQSKDEIYVYERRPYRWIIFNERYIQTMIHIHKPERPMLPYLHPFAVFCQLRPGNILLLGLGGGGLIHYLKPILKNHAITAIEKYPTMIAIAKDYFYLPTHPHLNIICADAKTYLHQREKTYPYILMDLGDLNGFPSDCANTHFFEHTYQNLTDEGVLVLNLTHSNEIPKFKDILTKIFTVTPLIISANGNWLLVVTKHAQAKVKLIELLNNNFYIKTYEWIPSFGACIQLHSQSLQKIRKRANTLLQKVKVYF